MSPETLIGMELGKGVLQRLLGQGTMGTVYLAYQSHLQRQVAVKVFLPASPLEQTDQVEFHKRLTQEITQAQILKHEHILAILDHGEHRGLIYEVMPYVAGESLQTRIRRSGMLPFVQIQHYLEQLAAALDYAHSQHILHGDIKPENILITAEDKLVVADFCVARPTTERNFARVRRATPGMLNYIAPEHVLGKTINARADLYSLGAVVYHMVTGSPLFEGASFSETAMKHVKAAPMSPRLLRKDLPEAAEQVILRALAKQPEDRYAHAQDMASALRLALEAAHALPVESSTTNALDALSDLASGGATAKMARIARSGGNSLFDPRWQNVNPASLQQEQQPFESATISSNPGLTETPAMAVFQNFPSPAETSKAGDATGQIPPNVSNSQETSSPLNSNSPQRTGLLRFANLQANPVEQPIEQNIPNATVNNPVQVENQPAWNTEELRFANAQNTTGMLFNTLANQPKEGQTTGTIKLTEPVRIVQMPVAGQPGRFVTGFLPMLAPEQSPEQEEETSAPKRAGKQINHVKVISVILAILIVTAGSGFFFWSTHNNRTSPTAQQVQKQQATPDLNANATAHAIATSTTSLILTDNLNQNIHDWPVGHQGSFTYTFKDGTYHIANNDKERSAPALLPHQVITGPFSYSLTMQQVKGDTKSPNNQFGMILYATTKTTKGKQVNQFYAFEVLNIAGGEYQFWKYDSGKNSDQPWTSLWTKDLGKEFHQGSGPSHVNTFKVTANGKSFTFFVNGKQVGTYKEKESSFSSGSIGMLVNLDGAEVAFSNLLLTHA